jgi:DNA invertase Pin-like site-specific DNA recombinase
MTRKTASRGRSSVGSAPSSSGTEKRSQWPTGQIAPVSGARPRYLGLTRVSTTDQAENGHSLDAQDATLKAEAVRRGWDLEIIPVPGRTGRKISPELRDTLDRLAAGEAQGLMVTKLDRLARSVGVVDDIIKAAQAQGWNLVVVALGIDLANPYGRMVAQLFAVIAEFEREMIAERTREGLAAAKLNGTKTGRPIGRPRLVSLELVRLIARKRSEGNSFQAIADHLADAGHISPEGRPTWQASTVRRIFNSTRLAVAA